MVRMGRPISATLFKWRREADGHRSERVPLSIGLLRAGLLQRTLLIERCRASFFLGAVRRHGRMCPAESLEPGTILHARLAPTMVREQRDEALLELQSRDRVDHAARHSWADDLPLGTVTVEVGAGAGGNNHRFR